MKKVILAVACAGWCLALLLSSGCASMAGKGTPFYTATEEHPAGAARDRIYLWPLLYYQSAPVG